MNRPSSRARSSDARKVDRAEKQPFWDEAKRIKGIGPSFESVGSVQGWDDGQANPIEVWGRSPVGRPKKARQAGLMRIRVQIRTRKASDHGRDAKVAFRMTNNADRGYED